MIDGKIKKRAELKKIVADLKKNKKRAVFTNGCFDILHYGHVKYLSDAKKMADALIVGLNSDKSVKRIKGENRPVNTELDRARVIAGLESVDYVTIFDEETPYELIKSILPDMIVKGSDWKERDIVGKDIVEKQGGKVVTVPFVESKSTSAIIDKIKNTC